MTDNSKTVVSCKCLAKGTKYKQEHQYVSLLTESSRTGKIMLLEVRIMVNLDWGKLLERLWETSGGGCWCSLSLNGCEEHRYVQSLKINQTVYL